MRTESPIKKDETRDPTVAMSIVREVGCFLMSSERGYDLPPTLVRDRHDFGGLHYGNRQDMGIGSS